MNVRAITLDVGGTLIEPWPSVGHIYASVAARHGVCGLSAQELNERFAKAWRAMSAFDHTREAWARLVDATFCGVEPPPSRTFFPQLYDRFTEPAAWRVYPDVVSALERWAKRGLKLGVISNWDDRLRPLLGKLELARWFDGIVVSCEAGCPKPCPAIFAQAVAKLGVSAGAVLHVGDSLDNDVHGARAAGLQSVWLRRKLKQSSPGVIRSLAELP